MRAVRLPELFEGIFFIADCQLSIADLTQLAIGN
jgi:hypothetical protein